MFISVDVHVDGRWCVLSKEASFDNTHPPPSTSTSTLINQLFTLNAYTPWISN